MTRATALAVVLTLGAGCGAPRASVAPGFVDRLPALPGGAEGAYTRIADVLDGDDAASIVSFMSQFWRLAGNPGFDASIDHIRQRLEQAGYSDAPSRSQTGTLAVESYPGARGWDYRMGTVMYESGDGEPLLSKERDRVSLAINSFSTPPGGVTATLVDVGQGAAESDYAGKPVKGAIVLGDASLGRLWQEAVKKRGALGAISSEIAPYIRPSDPERMTEEQKDVLQWGGIPYDETVRGFGFKAPWRAVARMRERLASGPVRVRTEIQSSFYHAPARMLIAEIPGKARPSERIVLAAHVQEPGANDNASGCGTLYALARALAEAIRKGALSPPDRTLTFLWLDEIRGSRQWMAAHADAARGVQYMIALDMTGEDTAKTGGAFLIEKQADPSAVWPRPSDPHTEWGGGGGVRSGSLKGSLLNDVHLAICLRRARDTGWLVRTNPYEGGSDHSAFAAAGVPSLLDWHFTDRYYHTNQDTPDKTSSAEMANVGIAVAATAWFLASATTRDAEAVAGLLADAGVRRLTLERRQGKLLVERAPNRIEASGTEQAVMNAWVRWYGEALDSVLTLPAAGADERLRSAVAQGRTALSRAAAEQAVTR